ncbi:MAG: hypothetical protein H7329_18825 [Opitutaceae bacterium]|nr:hypothetical protein [Cytophagales bacterium]
MVIFNWAIENKFLLFRGLVFLVVIFYFSVIILHSQNIPYWDDYVVTFQFFNDYSNADSLLTKVQALLAQWSEHRIVVGRLLAMSQFKIHGILNFKVLHFVSNLSLIIIFLGIIQSSCIEIRKWIVLPVALLLFQLQYYVASFWFVSSSSMFFVLAFSLLALIYLKREQYLICSVFSFAAVYSNGNGFLIFFLEIIFLLIARKWKPGLVLTGLFVVSILIYFKGYYPHENDRMATLYFMKDPIQTLNYFMSFLGGCFNVLGLAPVVGFTGICATIWFTYKKYYNQNPVLYLMLLFIIGSALLAAIGRSFWGVDQALESRYKIFSAVFWICMIISFLELQTEETRKIVFPWLVLGSLIFNVGSYYKSWPFMLKFLEAQRIDYDEVNSGRNRKNLNEAHQILIISRSKGYY